MRLKAITRVGLLLAVLLAAIHAPPPASAQSPTLTLEPAQQQAVSGGSVSLDVIVRDVGNLFAVDVHLAFDPALLQVVDFDAATPGVQVELRGGFVTPDFVAANQADNVAGTIDITFTQVSPTLPVSGSGTVATIAFTAGTTGQANVSVLSQRLLDHLAQPIALAVGGASISIGSDATRTASPTLPAGAPTATLPPGTGTAVASTPTRLAAATETPTPLPTPTAPPTETDAPQPSETPTASAAGTASSVPASSPAVATEAVAPTDATFVSPLPAPTQPVVTAATVIFISPLATPTKLARATATATPDPTTTPTPAEQALAAEQTPGPTARPAPRAEVPVAPSGGFFASLWFIAALVGAMIVAFAVFVAIPRARRR